MIEASHRNHMLPKEFLRNNQRHTFHIICRFWFAVVQCVLQSVLTKWVKKMMLNKFDNSLQYLVFFLLHIVDE